MINALSGPLAVLMSAALVSSVVTYTWPLATDVVGFAVVAALVGCVYAIVYLYFIV